MCGSQSFICVQPMPEPSPAGSPPDPFIGKVSIMPATPPFLLRESPEYPAPDPDDPEPSIPSGTGNGTLPPDEEVIERGMHQAWLAWYERQPEEFRRRARRSKERWVRYRLGLPLADSGA